MKKDFTITHNKATLRVETDQKNIYHVKYPDYKFIVLDHTEDGWVVEDRSGDYWSDKDIEAITALIEKNEPVVSEADNTDSE